MTNLSALLGVIGSLWTTLGGLAAVATASLAANVSIMFVVCAGSAAIAPVIYAAFARKEATNEGEAIGAVAGLLLAAATLFAIFGEMAAVSLIVWQVSAAPGARVSEALLQLVILAGAACVSAYSGRTLYSVISQSSVESRQGLRGRQAQVVPSDGKHQPGAEVGDAVGAAASTEMSACPSLQSHVRAAGIRSSSASGGTRNNLHEDSQAQRINP